MYLMISRLQKGTKHGKGARIKENNPTSGSFPQNWTKSGRSSLQVDQMRLRYAASWTNDSAINMGV